MLCRVRNWLKRISSTRFILAGADCSLTVAVAINVNVIYITIQVFSVDSLWMDQFLMECMQASVISIAGARLREV